MTFNFDFLDLINLTSDHFNVKISNIQLHKLIFYELLNDDPVSDFSHFRRTFPNNSRVRRVFLSVLAQALFQNSHSALKKKSAKKNCSENSP